MGFQVFPYLVTETSCLGYGGKMIFLMNLSCFDCCIFLKKISFSIFQLILPKHWIGVETQSATPFCRGLTLFPGMLQYIIKSWLHWLTEIKFCEKHYYWSLLYRAVLRCWADSLRSHVILHEWIAFFYSAFLNIHRSGVLTALAWLVPHESAAVLARSVYTIQPCTISLHAKPHTYGVCVFSCNLPPALLAEWPGSFTCYCGNMGVERIPK